MLAVKLGKTLQEVKRTTTSREFVRWMVFMEQEPNFFHRDDYNFAMIAAEIRDLRTAMTQKNGKTVDPKTLLIKFVSENGKKDKKESKSVMKDDDGLEVELVNEWEKDEEELEQELKDREMRIRKSKSYWCFIAGIDPTTGEAIKPCSN